MAMRLSWLGWLLLFVGGLSAASAPTSVVIVGVVNESGYRGALFQDEVATALQSALNATGVFAVRKVETGAKLPLTAPQLLSVGQAQKAQAVMQGSIKAVTLRKPKHDPIAQVLLEAVLVAVSPPRLIFKARAEGKGENPAEGHAVAQAVAHAAAEIARQLSTAMALRGQVLLPPAYAFLDPLRPTERDRFYAPTVRISLDMTNGLPVGAEVVILRRGNPVASGRVVEVDYGSSLVALTHWKPDTLPQTGDAVAVTYLPQHPRDFPLPLRKEREFRRAEQDFGWALLIAGVAAAFLGE
ncbi:MAG: hypothetical protein SLRJCFUN_001106 [Candidatus Fervidibacter sp.]|jgi:hypothetical protein